MSELKRPYSFPSAFSFPSALATARTCVIFYDVAAFAHARYTPMHSLGPTLVPIAFCKHLDLVTCLVVSDSTPLAL